MIGVACGLSAEGKVPFAHSFCCFTSRRACDQLQVSGAYARLNVRAVGTDPETEPDVRTLDRAPGALWLVCSDGLHSMVSDAEIAAILAGEGEDSGRAHRLLEAALTAGGHDNISLVLVREEAKA